MKIKLTILLSFLCFFSSLAQEKQEKWNVEIGWKPFDTNANYIGVDRVGAKYAISDRINVRMQFQYSRIKEHKELDEAQSSSRLYSIQTEYKNTEENYAFAPGIEYIFLRNSAISAYFGVELLYAVRTTTAEVYRQLDLFVLERKETTKSIINGLQYMEEFGYSSDTYSYTSSYHNPSYTLFGVQVPLGVDVHFYKKLYVGLEFQLYYHRKVINETQIYVDQLVEVSGEQNRIITTEKRSGAKAHSFGICFDSSIRFGIRF